MAVSGGCWHLCQSSPKDGTMRRINSCSENIKVRTWNSKPRRERPWSREYIPISSTNITALVQSLESSYLSLFHLPLHWLLLLPSQPEWSGDRATAMWAAGEPRLQPLGQSKLMGGSLQPSDSTKTEMQHKSPSPCSVTPTGPRLSWLQLDQGITDAIHLHQVSTQWVMSVKALESQKNAQSNPGHASSSPTPAKSLCQPCTIHSWFDALLSEMAFRLLMALSDRRWMPLLAVCHSSNLSRNGSTNAACKHEKTSSSSLNFFFVIGSSVKPEHKVIKDWHLFQMAPCTQKMNTYLLLAMLLFSGSFNL